MTPAPDHLLDFALRYSAAWCSQIPAAVAAHFSPTGSLTINGGPPCVGRTAIAEAARAFMLAFPDMRVFLDGLVPKDDHIVFHWTLSGTKTGPGGAGREVRISGFEQWQFGPDGLIAASLGHFDLDEYNRQLGHRLP